ncbi:MAG: hypothetical protein V9G15_14125 [Dermatophilaceae bacterium]|nr:hypothetical protein [Actinomycetales bacterium]MBP8880918.1 hypothetical protein [Dermatophilaceae bacterium]
MVPPIERDELRRFATFTEGKVSPKDVAKLYARAESLARLPRAVQRWIATHAGGHADLGFVVEPYALFLAYEITDVEAARALLPPGYTLAPTSMFAGNEPRYAAIVGAFNVHTSVFWGSRVEFYLIAENTRSGMLSWVMCDYESNTINYGPGEGFSGATTSRAVVTTTHRGEVLVDVRSAERANRLTVTAALAGAVSRPLVARLWIEGNLSVDYGGRLMDADSVPFGLVFDPAEMDAALDVGLAAITVEHNSFGAGLLAAEPFEVACFPYAQHFLTSTYPRASPIVDEDGLVEAVRAIAAVADAETDAEAD